MPIKFSSYINCFIINTNRLKFEGEYLIGKRNEKGKEYDDNGNLIFEGEYLNGQKHGNAREYVYWHKLI